MYRAALLCARRNNSRGTGAEKAPLGCGSEELGCVAGQNSADGEVMALRIHRGMPGRKGRGQTGEPCGQKEQMGEN